MLAGPVGTILRSLTPTAGQVPSIMVNLNTNAPILNPATVRDLAPLGANFSNTWELGYKGIYGNKVRVSADYWYQIRPADATTQVINPGVVMVGAALNPYLQAQISARLQSDYGVPPATAAAQATAAAAALAPLMAAIPQGAIAFNNPLYDQPYLVFSYQNATGHVDVRGIDLAVDYLVTDMFSIEATYSNLSRNVFADAPGSSAASPLAANTPKHRGSLTLRRINEARGMSAEIRGRYMDTFPVNSGVLNSYNIGTPVRYDEVPVNAFIDVGFSWRLPTAQNIRWSVNVQNLLDNQVQSFAGVAPVGRFATTRVQYTF